MALFYCKILFRWLVCLYNTEKICYDFIGFLPHKIIINEVVALKYTTYLFDFDGTLVDSMPAYVSVIKRLLLENNIACSPDLIKTITPLGAVSTVQYFIEELGLNRPELEILKTMEEYAYHEYAYNVPAKKNVIPVLKQLKEQGADLNVLTASPHITLDPCLKRLGMFDLFTNVWSCDDFNTSKADPAIYSMVAEKIGKPVHEILFLDDNFHADKTAKSAGMPVCGVYDASSDEYIEEIKAITDYYINDFIELLTLSDMTK